MTSTYRHLVLFVQCVRVEQWQTNTIPVGQKPWPSGYGRQLMLKRSWVQIPTPYTGLTFFHIDLLQKLYRLFEKTKNKPERGRGWPILIFNSCFECYFTRCLKWAIPKHPFLDVCNYS